MGHRMVFWAWIGGLLVFALAGCSRQDARRQPIAGKQQNARSSEQGQPVKPTEPFRFVPPEVKLPEPDGPRNPPQSQQAHKPVQPAADVFLTELLSAPDDLLLAETVFRRIRSVVESAAGRTAVVPEPQRVVYLVWGSKLIIEDGGFEELFKQQLSDFAAIAAAYETIGLSRAADAVRSALSVFPGGRPQPEVQLRLQYISQLAEDQREQLHNAARTIWDCQRQIQRQLAAYIRSQATAFYSLRPAAGEDPNVLKGKNLAPPDPDAYTRDVARWLESIDAAILVWQPSGGTQWFTKDLAAQVRGGARIIGVRLSPRRYSTDQELLVVASMESLRELVEVDLERTYVSASGIMALAGLPQLRRLNLCNTDAADSWMPHIAQLANLEELDLSRTNITDAALPQLVHLRQLRILGLWRTRITGRTLEHLALLPRLEKLVLARSAVRDEHLGGLAYLRNLRTLDLDKTQITTEALNHVEKLDRLEELWLAFTRVGNRGMACLRNLRNLRSLTLDETQVTDLGLAELQSLAELQELSLYGTEVGNLGMSFLKRLRKLRSLCLSNTLVGDEGLAQLAGLPELTELELNNTRVTDAGLAYLASFPKLQYVSLDTGGVSETAVQKLRAARAGVHIFR